MSHLKNVLSRRGLLRMGFGLAASAVIAACTRKVDTAASPAPTTSTGTTSSGTGGNTAVPTCVVKPGLTEGPYFVDEKLNRSDIRVDPSDGSTREGVPLRLVVNVSTVDGSSCRTLSGAQVDLWHCDALGVYSDVAAQNTQGRKFLRGYQVTDQNGKVEFLTVYPGWYSGRAVHIHFKIRSGSSEFTSQLFFDETTNAAVYRRAPYSSKGTADVPNARDGIYSQGGSQLLVTPVTDGDGYRGTFDIGLDVG